MESPLPNVEVKDPFHGSEVPRVWTALTERLAAPNGVTLPVAVPWNCLVVGSLNMDADPLKLIVMDVVPAAAGRLAKSPAKSHTASEDDQLHRGLSVTCVVCTRGILSPVAGNYKRGT